MTRFRYPDGWNTRREPGQRPTLKGSWLDPERVSMPCRGSYNYWTKIHWATPPWLSDEHIEQMKAIYERANSRHDHVDHVVPLKHPLVCGLNVPWNLQVVGQRSNLQKSNHYWPDCPPHLCPVQNLPEDMFGPAQPHQTRMLFA